MVTPNLQLTEPALASLAWGDPLNQNFTNIDAAAMLSVKAFGATGDGVTNDRTAINAAIAAVPDGGVVYFPAGTYISTYNGGKVHQITAKSVKFRGAGRGATILQPNSTAAGGFSGYSLETDGTRLELEDLTVQGPATNTIAGNLIYLASTGPQTLLMRNVLTQHGSATQVKLEQGGKTAVFEACEFGPGATGSTNAVHQVLSSSTGTGNFLFFTDCDFHGMGTCDAGYEATSHSCYLHIGTSFSYENCRWHDGVSGWVGYDIHNFSGSGTVEFSRVSNSSSSGYGRYLLSADSAGSIRYSNYTMSKTGLGTSGRAGQMQSTGKVFFVNSKFAQPSGVDLMFNQTTAGFLYYDNCEFATSRTSQVASNIAGTVIEASDCLFAGTATDISVGSSAVVRQDNCAYSGSGQKGRSTTANRPSAVNVGAGSSWYDTDLSLWLTSNGTLWYPLYGSVAYDPPDLNDGVGVTTTVTVTSAALGDYASASFSLDLQGVLLTAWVSAAGVVSVRFQNESGGTVVIASGTLKAWVRK